VGLREEKKARLRADLLETALAMFRERGFDETSIAAIAKSARISPATFFNYFPSKDALLDVHAHDLVADALELEGSDESASLRATFRESVRVLAERVERDADFLRVVFGRARLARLDARSGASAEAALLVRAQQRGEVRSDLRAAQIAAILVAAIEQSIAEWLRGDADAGELAPRLLAVADLVLDGARKKNERVRAPRGAAAG